jgi:hypothetical protein
MVIGPEWIGVGEFEVKGVDEPQAHKITRIKANVPKTRKILSMYGKKKLFGKASPFIYKQSLEVIMTLRK